MHTKMAMMNSIKRIFSSSRQISVRHRTVSVNSHRQFASLSSLSNSKLIVPENIDYTPTSTTTYFLFQHTRGFAKRRNTQTYDNDSDEEDGGTSGTADIGVTVKSAALSQMEAALEALSRDLAKLRTGRASVGMLDHIVVLTSGMKIPLNGMAAVSVLDPKTLSITPYDPNTIKELEKAIVASPLVSNPKVEGERLIAAIPPLTKEHIQSVCKLVTKSSEDVKQSIRRARQKALDTIKKSTPKKKEKEKTGLSISADDAKKLEKEVDEMTKKYIKLAEDMCKAKEKEVTTS